MLATLFIIEPRKGIGCHCRRVHRSVGKAGRSVGKAGQSARHALVLHTRMSTHRREGGHEHAHTHRYTHTHSLSLSLSLSHTHTHTHSHSHTHIPTQSPTDTPTHTLTHTHTHTHRRAHMESNQLCLKQRFVERLHCLHAMGVRSIACLSPPLILG